MPKPEPKPELELKKPKKLKKLKKWREVMEALRRAGFRPCRRMPLPCEPPFEKVVGHRYYILKGRPILIEVRYYFDDKKGKEVCKVMNIYREEVIEGEVTPEAVLKAIKDVKRDVTKALARLDAVATTKPLGDGFTVKYENEFEVSLLADVFDNKDCVGNLRFTAKPLFSSVEVRFFTHDTQKALRIMKKIVKAMKGAGYQLKPWW
jgi:hypothetical protein